MAGWKGPRCSPVELKRFITPFLLSLTLTAVCAAQLPPRAQWKNTREVELYRSNGLPGDLVLEDAQGGLIPVRATLSTRPDYYLLTAEEKLTPGASYFMRSRSENLNVRCRLDGWFETFRSGVALGAEVANSKDSTHFGLFAPRANEVTLRLFDSAHSTQPKSVHSMGQRGDGVWELTLPGDLHGTYYTFALQRPGGEFDSLSDPYARVQAESHGRSRVWRKTIPATPLKEGRPPMESVVAYEVHVQDFTDLLPVGESLRGTFPAMGRAGLKNSRGESVGIDYLADLGVNVVHLMPVQEYLHYPDQLWKRSLGGDPRMVDLGVAEENYQWGYRTTHAFAIENRYREKGTDQGAQREQFRDLVQAFHDRGIAVIVDIVPNHTGENMDGGSRVFNFTGIDPLYYYRTGEKGELIGPYGNEVKTEQRPLVRRWVIDQCRHLIEEFGLDGFRIDLAGQIDQQTLEALKAELGEDIIIYGEPWIDVSDPHVKAEPKWDWYKEDAPICFFQDSARDAFIGSPFRLENKRTDRGYAGGNEDLREQAMKALSNDYPEESRSTTQGINYLDIHDNWALADRFAKDDWDGRQGVEGDRYRIAATLLLSSAGPVVLHGGSEFLRSKGSAPLEEFERELQDGTVIHFKGRDDTYNMRSPNRFRWENLAKQECRGMRDFWRGLIRFRLSPEGEVFRKKRLDEGHYRWFLPENRSLLGYLVGEEVLVLINTGELDERFEIGSLPAGQWVQISDGSRVDLEGLGVVEIGPDGQIMPVSARTAEVWVKR